MQLGTKNVNHPKESVAMSSVLSDEEQQSEIVWVW